MEAVAEKTKEASTHEELRSVRVMDTEVQAEASKEQETR